MDTFTTIKENVESINQERVRSKNSYDIYLDDENEVEIFLDFLELNYNDPEEILEIKLINFKTQSKKSSSSSGNGGTIGGVIGGIGGLIIICAIVYCCCCKNKTKASPTNTTSGSVTFVPALIPVKKWRFILLLY